jgi:aminoglycoside phosphotransferase (APT) family kinase protein
MPSLDKPIALGRTAEVYAWEDGKVLKLLHNWVHPGNADHELRLARIIQASGLPVPAVFDIIEIDGCRGIVYERVDGPSMLDSMGKNPMGTRRYMRQLAELHIEMHTRSVPELPSQRERLQWKIEHAKPLPQELKVAALQALESLPDGDRLCHGDFHPGNILLTARGPIIIDWIDASRGNPLADVARTHVLFSTARLPGLSGVALLVRLAKRWMLEQYLQGYFASQPSERNALQAWMPVVAAARMEEGITHEFPQLLKIVKSCGIPSSAVPDGWRQN